MVLILFTRGEETISNRLSTFVPPLATTFWGQPFWGPLTSIAGRTTKRARAPLGLASGNFNISVSSAQVGPTTLLSEIAFALAVAVTASASRSAESCSYVKAQKVSTT